MTPHRYRIYVKATPEAVWQAITDPAYTRQYFHHTEFQSSLAEGEGYRYVSADGDGAVDGIIEVAEPPHRLVMTWHTLYDAALAAEPLSRVEWLLTAAGDGLTQVDLVHGDLARSPLTWANVQHGWVWILDGLKTLLETGEPLPDLAPPADAAEVAAADPSAEWHRAQAIECNNSCWNLIEQPSRTAANDEELLRRAYSAAYHWQRARGAGPANEARALYMLAKVHLLAGLAERSLHYADACLGQCTQHGLADFDLAYAHEARARALRAVGREAEGLEVWAVARSVPIADAEDQEIIDGDFADAP